MFFGVLIKEKNIKCVATMCHLIQDSLAQILWNSSGGKNTIHPFFFKLWVTRRVKPISMSLSRKQGTPWTGCKSIAVIMWSESLESPT